MTVGTQVAVLASLDVTKFIEFQPPNDSEWGDAYLIPRTLKFFYYIAITSAFCANILVVSQTTMLSLYGSSLALRGPDGSMIVATDGLYEEQRTVFYAFRVGLACTVGSVVLVVWLMLSPKATLVCMSITIFTGFQIYSQYLRVIKNFNFDEAETVDFTDIFDGPAAIMAIPTPMSVGNIHVPPWCCWESTKSCLHRNVSTIQHQEWSRPQTRGPSEHPPKSGGSPPFHG